jgi:uncharacterized protein (TIGR03437 family)
MCTMKVAAAFLAVAAWGQGPPGGAGDGIWLRDAFYGERETFDACFGHQPGAGQYHHHIQPVCLRAQLGDNLEAVASGRTGTTYRESTGGWKHSPILGWAYDGYPIYGPYGYSDPRNPASAIQRLKSSFQLRNITQRNSLPDWALAYHRGIPAQLSSTESGPPVSERFPLGRYIEDYDYVQKLGDLDVYNGRFTVTPEYPNGTYAYFIALKADGTPAFPYILGIQYNGTATTGPARTVPADAQDYFNNGQYTGNPGGGDALLASLLTKNSQSAAKAVMAWDPSAGSVTTWPGAQPAGLRTSGGVASPVNADVQRIRTSAGSVYVNSNDLPSYTIGPWFASMNGGVFMNLPSAQNFQAEVPRAPQPAAPAKINTGLGAVGIWVNGVSVFNAMDGASYSHTANDDAGGGLVSQTAINWSSASLEGGPVTPGALVTAYANFDAKLATSTALAADANWPLTLGGATVTVRDSAGASLPAAISYASPQQVNYRVPENAALGLATVSITAGGITVPGALNIVRTYPGLFKANLANLAAAQVARIQSGQAIYSSVAALNADGSISAAPVSLGPAAEQATLVLYGTGLNGAKDVSATIGGVQAAVAYAGPQGTYPGLDQINLVIPPGLSGKGKVDVILTAGGKPSNPVNFVIQ